VRTWTPTIGPHVGLLVTHNEAISIADYFTVFDRERGAAADATVNPAPADCASASMSSSDNAPVAVYRPTVHYAYYPCDETIASLHEARAAKFNTEPAQVKHTKTMPSHHLFQKPMICK
jgi:homospermidine synthase